MLNYFKRLPGRKVHCLRQEVKLTVNGGGIQNRKTYIMQSDDFPQSSMSTLYCIRNSHTSLVMPSSPAASCLHLLHLTSPYLSHSTCFPSLLFMKCNLATTHKYTLKNKGSKRVFFCLFFCSNAKEPF